MRFSLSRFTLTVVVAVAAMISWGVVLQARPTGVRGVCDQPDGCSCHGDTPNAKGAVTVDITGPTAVSIGTTSMYTITVSGGPPDTTGGFNLCADAGTLIPGSGDKLSNGELVHSNGGNRSWTFEWTAPNTEGTAGFVAVGLASNGANSSGDSWNWYGGAQGTPFVIDVMGTVDALPASWGMIKARYK